EINVSDSGKASAFVVVFILLFIVVGFFDIGLNDLLEKKPELQHPPVAEDKDHNDEYDSEDGFWNKGGDLAENEVYLAYVVDGDTISVITADGTEERVRLLLIDTPESVHPNGKVEPFGVESSKYAKEYFKGV